VLRESNLTYHNWALNVVYISPTPSRFNASYLYLSKGEGRFAIDGGQSSELCSSRGVYFEFCRDFDMYELEITHYYNTMTPGKSGFPEQLVVRSLPFPIAN
jgi:hypothetical protein